MKLHRKRSLIFLVAFAATCLVSFGQNFAGGIVYGPKAAFNISAPEGWVLDNQSGQNQGLPCALEEMLKNSFIYLEPKKEGSSSQ